MCLNIVQLSLTIHKAEIKICKYPATHSNVGFCLDVVVFIGFHEAQAEFPKIICIDANRLNGLQRDHDL